MANGHRAKERGGGRNERSGKGSRKERKALP